MLFIRLFFVLTSCVLFACSPNKGAETAGSSVQKLSLVPAKQQHIDEIAETLVIKYQHVDNTPSPMCDQSKENGNCFLARIVLTAKQPIVAKDWQIIFSQITPVQTSVSEEFTITHLNGDLHQITLTENFQGFQQGETKVIDFYANFWSLSETDALPNYIVASTNYLTDITPREIASTKVKIDPDTGLEILPYVVAYADEDKQFKRSKNDKTKWLTAERLYQRNQKQIFAGLDELNQQVKSQVIPTPKQASFSPNISLNIAQGFNYQYNNVAKDSVAAAIDRLARLGIADNANSDVKVKLNIQPQNDKPIGSYSLQINEKAITVSSGDNTGIFYGLQTLASLYRVGENTLPVGEVTDQPHFPFRSLLLDVARNFRDKNFVIKLLDQMSAYKLNKLHLHLGDDEGWRLEIPSLPELTQVGGKRCFDIQERNCLMPQLGAGLNTESPVNGYYRVADYQEILAAATARHIQVIPSLDMPGHSRAAVKAMTARYHHYMALEQPDKASQYLLHEFDDKTQYSSVQHYNDNTINVCLPSSFAFVKEVMQQVKTIHQQAGQPLTRYHIGADETAGAWVESPACQNFLANNTYQVTKASELGGYFVERVANMLADMGIEAAAWSDGLTHTRTERMPAIIQGNAWTPLMWNGHHAAHDMANRNWQVVVSSPEAFYFDFPYEADPKEHGYYWASRHINSEKIFQFMPENLPIHAEFWLDREDNPYIADDTLKLDENGKILSSPIQPGKRFIGVQGQLWSENTRTDNTAEYKLFPRLLSLAERGWHKADWAVDYDHQGFVYSQDRKRFTKQHQAARDIAWLKFSAAIGLKEFDKMAIDKVHFRLPNVGAEIINGKLHANIAYPGLDIQYREQAGTWQLYQAPVVVNGKVEVRAKHQKSDRLGRSLFLK